jgi:Zn-dependent protease/CBS domain-containing protein
MGTRVSSVAVKAGASMSGKRGVSLGYLGGVLVTLHWSLFIVFALITLALSLGPFPMWHPDWGSLTVGLTAVAAALLFIASILVHELAHAIVARRLGVGVRQVTLFVFGGMAHLEHEPRNWGVELAIAIAGPAASLALGIVFLYLGGFVTGPEKWVPDDPMLTLSQAGPVATVFFWLGPVNLLLGLFNLVPGFPLDGGRVLRALFWGTTGDLVRATRWAAGIGQGFAWLLIASGVAMILGIQVPILGSGALAGIWVALVGWFLYQAAKVGYRRLLAQELLGDLPVTSLMNTSFKAVGPGMTVQELVDQHALPGGRALFPVVEDGRFDGLLSAADVRRIDADRRAATRVDEIMTPVHHLATLSAEARAADALYQLTQHPSSQIPIVDGGRLLGFVAREDILRGLAASRRHSSTGESGQEGEEEVSRKPSLSDGTATRRHD